MNTESPFKKIAEGLMNPPQEAVEQVSDASPTAPADEVEDTTLETPAPQENEATGDEGDGEPDESTARLIPVVIDGDVQMLPEAEVAAGYLRKQDYGRLIREASETKKQAESEKSQVQNLQKQLAQELDAVIAIQSSMAPTAEAMNAALQAGNTKAYLEMQNRLNWLQQMKARQEQVVGMTKEQQKAQLQATVAEEHKALIAAMPEFKDEAALKKVSQYALDIGFTQEEVNSIYHSRHVIALEKARRYDELMAKQPGVKKVVESAPKLAKPAARQSKQTVEHHQYSQAMKTLQETGRFQSASERNAVFGKFIGA